MAKQIGGKAGVTGIALTLAVSACGDAATGPAPGIPASMEIVAGQDQSGAVGTELPTPLRVRVRDSAGLIVRGQVVNFRVTAGGGGVFAGVSITNDSGLAQDRWTLGTSTADSQRVEARAVDNNTGEPLTFAVFRAVPLPGLAAAVVEASGNAQTGPIGAALPDSLAAKAVDRYGNAVPGASVAWTNVAGGGALSPTGGVTNAAGIVKAAWTLGPRLDTTHVATAASGALPAARFTATPVVPAGATLTLTSGDGQTGTVGQVLADTLVVTMRLADGRPVRGAAVSWSAAPGSGSVVAVDPVSDDLGRSKARWTIGIVVGNHTAQAAAYSLPPVALTAVGTPDDPDSVSAMDPGMFYGVPNETLPDSLRARVMDRYGNAVPEVGVAWNVKGGGGSLAPSAATTDAAGMTATSWTLGAAPGLNVASAFVPGVANAAFFGAQATVPLAIVVPGQSHTCALATADYGTAPYCWGWNSAGLGAPTTELCGGIYPCSTFPMPLSGGIQFVQLSAHLGKHTCGLTAEGAAYCWGANDVGQIGDGTTTNRSEPTAVAGGLTFRTIAAGWSHTCAVATDDMTYCWGVNYSGQLGRWNTGERCGATATIPGATCSTQPLPVIGQDSTAIPTFTSLSLGFQTTCGLTSAGVAYCWGANGFGQLGGGSATPGATPTPTPVAGGLTFGSISVGDLHACGVTATGAAFCWGSNRNGELGIGSRDEQAHPEPNAVSGGLTFANISGGGFGGGFTCGATTTGTGYCWGFNIYNQLGNGSTNGATVPGPVAGALELQLIAAGVDHACALTTRAAAYCWGEGGVGQLGSGGMTNSAVPTRVKGPTVP